MHRNDERSIDARLAIDRIVAGSDGVTISDFKSGAVLEDATDNDSEIKVEYKVQLMLYAALYKIAKGEWPRRLLLRSNGCKHREAQGLGERIFELLFFCFQLKGHVIFGVGVQTAASDLFNQLIGSFQPRRQRGGDRFGMLGRKVIFGFFDQGIDPRETVLQERGFAALRQTGDAQKRDVDATPYPQRYRGGRRRVQ